MNEPINRLVKDVLNCGDGPDPYPLGDPSGIQPTERGKIVKAISLAVRYGGIDGDHHKAWVIDQMVRVLSGCDYDAIVASARDGEDGPETFDWNCGIAP